jgi:molybdopterin molybdotransferase
VPDGATAVVPVEETSEQWRSKRRHLRKTVDIFTQIEVGAHIRLVGEDVKAGTSVITRGKMIRSQEIALLASLGFNKIKVIGQPKVGILSTGDELIPITEPLAPGKIRNSNGSTQSAQVLALDAIPVDLGVARDTTEDVRKKLKKGLELGVDLIISSAGVSVGAYDVVKKVLETEGDVNFWRVRMRPGKPLTYGQYNGIPFLGLPGNPVSAMVSFERFARPAILKMAGWSNYDRPTVQVRVEEEINSDGRESYLRAIVKRDSSGYFAQTLRSQGSHMITSMVNANSLLIIPEGVTKVPPGTTLTAMMIDWPPTVF